MSWLDTFPVKTFERDKLENKSQESRERLDGQQHHIFLPLGFVVSMFACYKKNRQSGSGTEFRLLYRQFQEFKLWPHR